jgi:hypothetical protein
MSERRARPLPLLPLVAALPAAAFLLAAVPPHAATAQSLRGSRRSVNRMHDRAVANHLQFYDTFRAVRSAEGRGRFVPLDRGAGYEVAVTGDVPVVLPTTRDFVRRLAGQYRAACGGTLVVTGATRPLDRQLVNSSSRSVHPTGMAVDLRKPSGRCLTWLRRTLLAQERAGLIEATEEHRPPHFHVAVFPRAGERDPGARRLAKAD